MSKVLRSIVSAIAKLSNPLAVPAIVYKCMRPVAAPAVWPAGEGVPDLSCVEFLETVGRVLDK